MQTLCKCLLPTLLSIWHGHNDGLTYSTGWNGVQISKLNSICNYCDDLLTPWTNYLLNCTIHRFCSNYFLRSHYWKKIYICKNQWTYIKVWTEVYFCSATFAVCPSFLHRKAFTWFLNSVSIGVVDTYVNSWLQVPQFTISEFQLSMHAHV